MASCSPTPRARSAARPKLGTSRIQKIARSQRRGVGDTRCAEACERFGVVMSTGKGAGKPRGNVIDVGIGILTIKLRLEINRLRWCSRIQDHDKFACPQQVKSDWSVNEPLWRQGARTNRSKVLQMHRAERADVNEDLPWQLRVSRLRQ